MGYKATIDKGKRAFTDMIRGLEYEILRLKDENLKLKEELEKLKEVNNGEP